MLIRTVKDLNETDIYRISFVVIDNKAIKPINCYWKGNNLIVEYWGDNKITDKVLSDSDLVHIKN